MSRRGVPLTMAAFAISFDGIGAPKVFLVFFAPLILLGPPLGRDYPFWVVVSTG